MARAFLRTTVVGVVAAVVLSGCKPSVPAVPVGESVVKEGSLVDGTVDTREIGCLTDEYLLSWITSADCEAYHALYRALQNPETAPPYVAAVLAPAQEQIPGAAYRAAYMVETRADCAAGIIDQLLQDLNVSFERRAGAGAFFWFLSQVLASKLVTTAWPKGSFAQRSGPTGELKDAIVALGDATIEAGNAMYSVTSAENVVEAHHDEVSCHLIDGAGEVAEPARGLEPYVVASAPGYTTGSYHWMDGTVALNDFARDPSGNSPVVYDGDLNPVDFSAVREPDIVHAISGGVLALGADASGVLGWHAVQDGEITYTLPHTWWQAPTVGYRYAVVPTSPDGTSCAGRVVELATGAGNGVLTDQCFDGIVGHYGLVAGGSGDDRRAVDLLTGKTVAAPVPEAVASGASVSYDDGSVAWAVPLAGEAREVTVSEGRVAYQLGDDAVIVDAATGGEIVRFALEPLTGFAGCVINGHVSRDRLLVSCGTSNVTAATYSLGFSTFRSAEGGSL